MKNQDGTLGFPDIDRNRNRSEDDMSTTGGQKDPFDIALSSGAYALNALSEEEQLEFEAHLAESPTTRNEVTEMAETAAILGLSVTPVTPSPEMKRNLMAMLASTPQLPKQTPAELNAELNLALGRESPTAADQTPATVVPVFEAMPVESETAAPVPPSELSARSTAKTQARWFNRPIMALTAVAAAFVLIVGGSSVVNLVNDATYQQQQADQLAQITSAEDMQQTVAAVSTGGTATLMWSEELGKSVVVADGLAELSSDETYELWYITADGTPSAAGLFDVDGSDNVWRVLDGEMEAGVTVGVTVEPKGGSEQPTTDPIVAISSAA
jgi:anti-sigma-K factor RskA